MILVELEVKDTAVMLRWVEGVTKGDAVADDFEGLVNDAVTETLCLDPKTPPRSAPRMSINAFIPHNDICLLARVSAPVGDEDGSCAD